MLIAQDPTRLDPCPQLTRIAQHPRLEPQTPRAIDLLHKALPEHRQQMQLHAASVASRRTRANLPICPLGLRYQPPSRIRLKARPRTGATRAHRRRRTFPRPQPDPRDRLGELTPRRQLIPSPAATAITAMSFVQGHDLALAVCVETQPEDAGAIG